MSDDRSERIYGLDIFRSLAILLVLMGHSFEHSSLAPWVADFGRLGVLGVELFFVLSGFLIGGIIVRLIDQGRLRGVADLLGFWKRRWLRTLPLYFVIYLAFLRFDYHGRHGLFDYPLYLVFFQNFAWRIPEFFELSWSLSVEEHFYIWFPLLYLGCARFLKGGLRPLVFAAGIFVCIVYLYRCVHPLYTDFNEFQRMIRLTVLSRLDAVMYGVLMVALRRYRPTAFDWVRRLTPLWMLSFGLMAWWYYQDVPGLMTSKIAQVNIYTLQGVICSLLLPWFVSIEDKSGTVHGRFFVVTSRLSYSLYLVHILVIIFVNRALTWAGFFQTIYPHPLAIYPIYFSLYYAAAWITYSSIEKPFLKLRGMAFSWKETARAAWPALGAVTYLTAFA